LLLQYQSNELAQITCGDCNWSASTLVDSGLEDLVLATTAMLPEAVIKSFMIAQTQTLVYQDAKAKEYIMQLWVRLLSHSV
jgi:hypothetical protein